MSVEVRAFAPDDAGAVAAYCAIRTAVDPDDGETPEGIAWEEATYPGQVWRFLATVDGETVGAATTGRLHVYPADHPRFYLGIWALDRAPRAEVQAALYRAASDRARAAGKTGFRCWVSEIQTEFVGLLRSIGFVEQDRSKAVALDLRGLRGRPDAGVARAEPPAGFEIVTLAERPELVAGVHACAVEAFPSIPSAAPMDPGTLEEFKARDVYRERVPIDGFFVALDTASGEVAGYANLIFAPGSTTIAHHDMTAVRPAFRGRGLALALKRATIAWAVRSGLEELRANNDEENAPMRGINARLGYRPLPDEVGLEGPLAPEG
jgi:mycothiol synthase